MDPFDLPHITDDSTVKRPQFVYANKLTGCTLTSNIREQNLWCGPCGEQSVWTMLHRVITAPFMAEVIHAEFSPATGKVIGDRRQFAAALRESADKQAAVTGYQPNIVEASAKELTKGDAGLKEQHDRHVQLGWKEPTGKLY